MVLKGYQKQATPTPQVPQATSVGAQQSAQTMQSLSDRLERFSDFQLKQREIETVDRATQDAYTASVNGDPFYKESVTTAYGRAYNSVASATYASNANLDINRISNQLSIDYENDPEGYDSNMDEYIRSLANSAPTPELNSVISISGAKTKNSMYGKLKTFEYGRIKAEQVETFNQEWDLNVSQIIELQATDNTKDSELLKAKNMEHLKSMNREGLIDGATAQSLVDKAEFSITNGTALRNMEELLLEDDLTNASKYLNAEVTQERADMTPDQNAAHQASLQKLYSSELRARKAEEKKVSDYSTQMLKDEIKIIEDGGVSAYSEEEIESAFTNSTSKDVKYKYAQQKTIQRVVSDWSTLSIPEQEDRIALLENKPRKGVDQKLIEQLRTTLKERKARADKDPVGLAIKEGVIEAPEYKMSAADGVDSLIAGIEGMKDEQYKIKETYGEDKTFLLQSEDAKSWADYFEAPGNTNDKLDTIEKITQYQPEVAKQIFGQISKKNAPSMTFAATLSLDGNREAARLSLKGKYAKVSVDDEAAIKKEVSAKIGNTFSHYQDPSVYNQMFNGVVNYNRGAVSEGVEALDADDAVIATLGQVKSYNGKDVILPRGVDANQFENWVNEIEIPGNTALESRIRSAVDVFGDKNVQFHYAGQGQYYVQLSRGGKNFYVEGEDNKPLILDYNAE